MDFLTALVLIGIGLLSVFFGYRLFRILLPIIGGIAGFVIASNLFPDSWFLALIFGVAIAIVLAILAYAAWSVFVALAGAGLGAGIGAAIATGLNLWDWVGWILIIALAVLGAIIVWKIRDEAVIILTAIAGAGYVSDGLQRILGEGTIRNFLYFLIFAVLAIVGIWWQWQRYRHLRLLGFGGPGEVPASRAPVPATPAVPPAAVAPAVPAAAAAATAAAVAAKSDVAAAPAGAPTAAVAATEAAKAAVTEPAAKAPAAPKLTLEERQAMINQHLDELLSGEGDRSNLGEDLSFLKDLSPDQEAKLKGAGLAVVIDILRRGATAAGRAELSRSTGVPESTILKWVNFADLLRIKGVGAVYARLLEAAGVDTVVELAQRNPVNLHARLVEVNAEQKLSGRDPRQEEVTDWVAQAKELPRIVEY
jgi:predicted flap endonuclease-1-like 5' DNA nuclease